MKEQIKWLIDIYERRIKSLTELMIELHENNPRRHAVIAKRSIYREVLRDLKDLMKNHEEDKTRMEEI